MRPVSTVSAVAGAAEHDGAPERGHHRGTQLDALGAGELPEVVLHLRQVRGGLANLVAYRVVLIRAGDLRDLTVESR